MFAHVGNGKLDVDGYHGGTLIAMTRIGAVTLSNLGGTVFAQTFRGPIVARASTFDRVRARSLFGNVTFERCNVRQIEATTVAGSIVYDRGSFAPGLARFESIDGNVAIGASGNVQYGAHAMGDGRVYTNFTGRVSVDARNGQTSAIAKPRRCERRSVSCRPRPSAASRTSTSADARPLQQKLPHHRNVELPRVLGEDRFDFVAARLEEGARRKIGRRFERHLVAVVIVREYLGAVEEPASDAAAPARRIDDQGIDVRERGRDT